MSGSGDGATNCGFTSWAQCMETARGNGGYCSRNPWSEYAPTITQPRPRKHAQKRARF
jgi:hypothetical protein